MKSNNNLLISASNYMTHEAQQNKIAFKLFTLLPSELALAILVYLNADNLILLNRVSKGLCKLSNDVYLWNIIATDNEIKMVEGVHPKSEYLKSYIRSWKVAGEKFGYAHPDIDPFNLGNGFTEEEQKENAKQLTGWMGFWIGRSVIKLSNAVGYTAHTIENFYNKKTKF